MLLLLMVVMVMLLLLLRRGERRWGYLGRRGIVVVLTSIGWHEAMMRMRMRLMRRRHRLHHVRARRMICAGGNKRRRRVMRRSRGRSAWLAPWRLLVIERRGIGRMLLLLRIGMVLLMVLHAELRMQMDPTTSSCWW